MRKITNALRKKKTSKRSMTMKKREIISFYIIILPFILMYLFLRLAPFLWGMGLSTTNFTGFNWENMSFRGADNYVRALTDTTAIHALTRTWIITLMIVPIGVIAGFLLALLLNNPLRGMGAYRTIYYLPSIVPPVAVGLMWRVIFSQQDGLFNLILRNLGFSGVHWLGFEWATRSLIIMMAWASGGGLLIYLAALKNIPEELYESAAMDGAKAFKRFRHITIPMMTPIFFYLIIMQAIAALQLFAQPVLLTTGQSGLLNVPLRPNYTFQVHIYQQIFGMQRFGYGLALIWILVVIILIVTSLIFKTSRHWVHYEVNPDN